MSSQNEQPHFHIIPIHMSDNKYEAHMADKVTHDTDEDNNLPNWQQATAQISPHSTLVALATHPNDNSAP